MSGSVQPVRRGALSEALLPLVRAGLSTPEMVARLPHLRAISISVRASKLRKELGLRSGHVQKYTGLPLPRHIYDALQVEALARGGYNGSVSLLALRLLGIIVQDNLFDAILGDEP